MVNPSRYLSGGIGYVDYRENFSAKGSKDRRARFRIAKRKAEREAMKIAEADLIDEWAEFEDWQQRTEAEDQYWQEYDNLLFEDECWRDHRDDWNDDFYDRGAWSYPPGTVCSLDELVKFYSWIYVASKTFRTVHEKKYAGDLSLAELIDYNITKLNGYNDWFVFTNREDAEMWAQL